MVAAVKKLQDSEMSMDNSTVALTSGIILAHEGACPWRGRVATWRATEDGAVRAHVRVSVCARARVPDNRCRRGFLSRRVPNPA